MILFLLFAALAALFTIRAHWLSYHVEQYRLNAAFYIWKSKKKDVLEEMSRIWPYYLVMLEIWRWDFNRYVIHQDHLYEMEGYIAEALERSDLGWEEINGESPTGSDDIPRGD